MPLDCLVRFFPHAAGEIASRGPYESVKDIYHLAGLTERDKELFKKYEGNFAVLSPGRQFNERLNGRQSMILTQRQPCLRPKVGLCARI